MANIGSAPDVYRNEIDLSDVLVATGISNGGTVVRAKKGPVRRPVLVTNNKEYIEYYKHLYQSFFPLIQQKSLVVSNFQLFYLSEFP